MSEVKETLLLRFTRVFFLLLAKIDLIIEEQVYKRDAFMVCGITYIKIILRLSIKVVKLYM